MRGAILATHLKKVMYSTCETRMKKGSLEVICGSMFSGKTEELLRRLKRAEYAKKNVLTIKHRIDNRTSYTCITTHSGQKREAFPLGGGLQHISQALELAHDEVEVIGFDEIQFFGPEIIAIIRELVDQDKRVIVAGLDLDFRGEPFQVTSQLLAFADSIVKLKAICVKCGKDAYVSQRLINGVPAKFSDPIILVGAQECYEARCRNCFRIGYPENESPSTPAQPFKNPSHQNQAP
jgi:thymidine kinase